MDKYFKEIVQCLTIDFYSHYEIDSANEYNGNFHLAIMHQPYLDYIIKGKKKIETRFFLQKRPPYNCINENDIIFFKKVGGDIYCSCKIKKCSKYNLHLTDKNMLISKYYDDVCMSKECWREKLQKNFALFISIGKLFFFDKPITITKRDRRPWVVFNREKQSQLPLFYMLH